MAFKGKIPLPRLSKTVLWRAALGALLLFAVLLLVGLWLSGKSETRTAFADGRRLLIRLDNNTIEGKQILIEQATPPQPPLPPVEKMKEPPPAAAAAPAEKPAEPSPAINTPAEMPAEKAPDKTSEAEPPPVTLPPVAAAAVPIPGPNAALIQQTADGPMPMVANGQKPWQYYGKAYERKGSLPMIAIVVSGLGVNKSVAESALSLPETVTLSFSPYTHDMENWATASRAAGHEMMIDLPLELSSYPASDPGPYGLLVANDPTENSRRMAWLMTRFAGYVGFLMPQNEGFSSNDTAFKAMLKSIDDHGLMIVIDHEPAMDATKATIRESRVAHVTADVLIDEELSPDAIQARLQSLQQAAKEHGYAVGIAQPYPISIQQISLWSAKLAQAGFVLVPVSFVARLKTS